MAARRGNFPTFSPAGLPSLVVQPVQQGFTEVQSFLKRGHNRDGTVSAIRNWIDLPYISSRFTFSGTGSWGVTAANVTSLKYASIDKIFLFRGTIVNTNVTAPLGTQLRVGLPTGVTFKTEAIGYLLYEDAGGVRTVGVAVAEAGAAYLALERNVAADWTATAGNNTSVRFNITCEIA